MISVVIPTLNSAATLPRVLAPLVQGVADGLVKQAIIADGGSDDDTRAIADAAGCDVVSGGRANGAAAAKGSWFLFLDATTLLDEGWLEDARRFTVRSDNAAAFSLGVENDLPALVAARARELMKQPLAAQGLLISRKLYEAVGGYGDDIIDRIGPGRLTILRTKAYVIR